MCPPFVKIMTEEFFVIGIMVFAFLSALVVSIWGDNLRKENERLEEESFKRYTEELRKNRKKFF